MNDTKQVQSTVRPLRVAYLVNLEDCPAELLDAIFAECYARWSGRRTLIVPANLESGVHEDYKEWLLVHDPDIIYSYVNLSEEVVFEINETYCPLYLRKHEERIEPDGTDRDYVPNLPLTGLSCLSTFPLILDRKGFDDFSNSKVLDYDFGLSPSRFVNDNFGTFRTSYRNGFTATSNPNLYTAYTLIRQEHLEDPRRVKDKKREYESDFNQYIRNLYTRGCKTLTLSMLSEYFGWYLNFYSHNKSSTFNLVIGASAYDRLLFWNFRQNYDRVGVVEIPDLVVSEEEINDPVMREHILEIIKYRQQRSHSEYPMTLRSFSLSEERLNGIAQTIRDECPLSQVDVQKITEHKDYIPNIIRNREPVAFRTGMNWNEPKAIYKFNYSGSQFDIYETLPFHMKEVQVPANLRGGAWMIDLCVERQLKHSRIINREHVWTFSRRLRSDRQFQRLDSAPQQDYNYRTMRVNRDELLSIPVKYSGENPRFKIPDDETALLGPFFSMFDYDSFDKYGEPILRGKFYMQETSDKGRYFKGFMQHFRSISDAQQVILNKFWYKIFSDLGATSRKNKDQNIQAIVQKIDKLQNGKKPSQFLSTEKAKQAFASTCLKAALKVAKEKEFVTWKEMMDFWEEYYKAFIKKNPQLKDREDEIREQDQISVERSAQFLCKNKIIFQGQRWTCPSCLHKNWESIESLSALLKCEVCSKEQSAPISSDWHFKLNDFILEAMREHGTTALIWCLIQLHNKARYSFYYVPSTKLFSVDENGNEAEPREIDLMAIVDGDLYVCEVKSAGGLSQKEVKNFSGVVNVIRPDIACLAIMENITPKKKDTIRNRLAQEIESGIKIEVISLEDTHFCDDTSLPSGNMITLQL